MLSKNITWCSDAVITKGDRKLLYHCKHAFLKWCKLHYVCYFIIEGIHYKGVHFFRLYTLYFYFSFSDHAFSWQRTKFFFPHLFSSSSYTNQIHREKVYWLWGFTEATCGLWVMPEQGNLGINFDPIKGVLLCADISTLTYMRFLQGLKTWRLWPDRACGTLLQQKFSVLPSSSL